MAKTPAAPKKSVLFRHVGRVATLVTSFGAALVSIVSALYSYGVIGHSESHQSIGNIGAAWVGLRPSIDTAYAVDDTVHYAATVTDNAGSVLVGARPMWTTGDSSVATVLPNGSVVAHGRGRTTVTIVVGKLITHATIVVQQRVASVEVAGASRDSAIVLAEGAQLQLRARGMDARGHPISGLTVAWHVDGKDVATLDSTGVITGRSAGRVTVAATIEGVSARTGVSVVTPASAIALVMGMNQRALAGKTLPQKLIVRATNRRGGPAAGKRVTFRLADGQGAVDQATAVTDADGRARTLWTLGPSPGRQTLLASVESVDSALAIVAEADPVSSNTRVAAVVDHLSGHAGDELSDPIAIRVTDSLGRVLPDVPVRWSVVDGGSVRETDERTDSSGVASARWMLAKKTGTQRVRAQVGRANGLGIPPVTISASALAGAAATIVAASGDAQHAAAGAKLPKPVVLQVVDENGSSVAGAALALSASGGALDDSALVTDSLGFARARWTIGHATGDYTLTVHVAGVKKPLKVLAHATPAAAANLAFDDLPADKRSREPVKPKRLLAVVTDVYGNPVPDAKMKFSVKSGTVTPARAVTDAKGRAELTWKLGSKPGEQTLTGVVGGTDVTAEYVTQVASHEVTAKATSLKPANK